MKYFRFAILLSLIAVTTACGGMATPNENVVAASQKICGDAVCDGPENSTNCPEDCSATGVVSGEEEKQTSSNSEQPVENGVRYVSFSGTIEVVHVGPEEFI